MNLPQKQHIVGIGISRTSYKEVVELTHLWAKQRKAGQSHTIARYVCVTSVHGVIMAQDDARVATILNEADLVTPDGMPIVWAMRSFGHRGQQRVYGPTLMLEICRKAALEGIRIFLYGGRDETLPILRHELHSRFPGLRIVGAYSPPFRPLTAEEELDVRRRITESGADIVFVGISTPKQEQWMYDHRQYFPGVTLIGVGAAFDFHAGRTKQAPAWMQRNGLEWLFRLTMEPARLWKRYLLITPRFLPLWAMQRMRTVLSR